VQAFLKWSYPERVGTRTGLGLNVGAAAGRASDDVCRQLVFATSERKATCSDGDNDDV